MTTVTRPITLLPEHMSALASAQPSGLLAAQICRGGRFDESGFTLYGQLEFLANCGLVEFIAQAGKRCVAAGDVWMYYFLTEPGRVLLRWRTGAETVGPIQRSPQRRRTSHRHDGGLESSAH